VVSVSSLLLDSGGAAGYIDFQTKKVSRSSIHVIDLTETLQNNLLLLSNARGLTYCIIVLV